MAIPMLESKGQLLFSSGKEVTKDFVSESLGVTRALSKSWTVIIGVIGACLLSFTSVAVAGILRHDEALEAVQLSWMRFGHGRDISITLAWLGLCLMVYAWVRAGRLVLSGAVTLRWLSRTMMCWVAPLLAAAPIGTRDPYSYLAQGGLLRDGLSPYSNGPVMNPNTYADNVAEVWSTTGSPYGPLFMLLMKLMTTLVGNHIVAGVILTRIIMLPGVFLTYWAVMALAQHFGRKPEFAVWLAMLNPLMVVNMIGGAHNEMLMVGFLSAGMVMMLRNQPLKGTALIVTAACIKATALIALPFAGWVWLAHVVRQEGHSSREQPWAACREYVKIIGKMIGITVGIFTLWSVIAGVDLGWSKEIFDTLVVVNWLAIPTAVAQFVEFVVGRPLGWNAQETLDTSRSIFLILLIVLLATVWWRARESLWSSYKVGAPQSERPGLPEKCSHFLRRAFAGNTDSVLGARAVMGAVLAMIVTIELSAAAFPWYLSWPLALSAALVSTALTRVIIVFISVAMLFMFGFDGDEQMYSLAVLLSAAVISGVAALYVWRSPHADPVVPVIEKIA